MTRSIKILLIAGSTAVFAMSGWARGLSTPWDNVPIGHSGAKTEACPVQPAVAADLTVAGGIYSDADRHERDPAKVKQYGAAVKDVRAAATAVAKFADLYRLRGDASYATCAAGMLRKLAAEGALSGRIDGYQASFTRIWMASSFAMAWLKIDDEKEVDQPTADAVNAWLAKLAAGIRERWEGGYQKTHQVNNIGAWAALAVMAAGAGSGNRADFDWGVKLYKLEIDQIDDRGFLPEELTRGERARLYHVFAATPLATVAELARANGVDLYQYKPEQTRKLMLRTAESFIDPGPLTKAAGAKQLDANADRPFFGWLAPYAARFPDPKFNEVLTKYPARSNLYLGGVAIPEAK